MGGTLEYVGGTLGYVGGTLGYVRSILGSLLSEGGLSVTIYCILLSITLYTRLFTIIYCCHLD